MSIKARVGGAWVPLGGVVETVNADFITNITESAVITLPGLAIPSASESVTYPTLVSTVTETSTVTLF